MIKCWAAHTRHYLWAQDHSGQLKMIQAKCTSRIGEKTCPTEHARLQSTVVLSQTEKPKRQRWFSPSFRLSPMVFYFSFSMFNQLYLTSPSIGVLSHHLNFNHAALKEKKLENLESIGYRHAKLFLVDGVTEVEKHLWDAFRRACLGVWLW